MRYVCLSETCYSTVLEIYVWNAHLMIKILVIQNVLLTLSCKSDTNLLYQTKETILKSIKNKEKVNLDLTTIRKHPFQIL